MISLHDHRAEAVLIRVYEKEYDQALERAYSKFFFHDWFKLMQASMDSASL